MLRVSLLTSLLLVIGLMAAPKNPSRRLDVEPKPIKADASIKYDYDIVYVRAPRFVPGRGGKQRPSAWPEIAHPTNIDPGYDLMPLHPDGKEELLVEGGKGSVTDPFVAFDGQWVYYAYYHDPAPSAGSDIYEIHVRPRKVVRLADRGYSPKTAAVAPASQESGAPRRAQQGKVAVYNLGPCPVPGGKVVFTSTRDGVKPPRGYPRQAHQLYVMD